MENENCRCKTALEWLSAIECDNEANVKPPALSVMSEASDRSVRGRLQETMTGDRTGDR